MFLEEKIDHLVTVVAQLVEQQKQLVELLIAKETRSSKTPSSPAIPVENPKESKNSEPKTKKQRLLLKIFGSRLNFRKVKPPAGQNLSFGEDKASNSENVQIESNDLEDPIPSPRSSKSDGKNKEHRRHHRNDKENHETSRGKHKHKIQNSSPLSEKNRVELPTSRARHYSNPARNEGPRLDDIQNSSGEGLPLVFDYSRGTSYRKRSSSIHNSNQTRNPSCSHGTNSYAHQGCLTLQPGKIIVPDTETIIRDLKANQCKECGKTFRTKSKLRIHKQSLHLDVDMTKFKCTKCKKGYPTELQLLVHQNFHNTSQRTKKFACEHCERRYVRKSDLVAHTRVHSGDRPFVCTICHKGFIRMAALTYHVKSTHIALSCPDCRKGFKRRISLKHHRSQCKGSMSHDSDIDDLSYAKTKKDLHRAAAGFIFS